MAASDHLSPGQFVYRGMPMRPGVQPDPESVRAALVDPFTDTRAAGVHWTTSMGIAREAASTRPGTYGSVNVVLHASHPGAEHLMGGRERRNRAVEGDREQEVPVTRRAPLHVHGVDIAVTTGPYRSPYKHHPVSWDERA